MDGVCSLSTRLASCARLVFGEVSGGSGADVGAGILEEDGDSAVMALVVVDCGDHRLELLLFGPRTVVAKEQQE